MKARVRALADLEGTNESAIVKRLLHDALRAQPCSDPLPAKPPRDERRQRICVRIGSEDRRVLTQRAAERGLALGTYMAFLTRTHLQGRAPLPKREHLALRASVLALKAIGRNLNQIARAANRRPNAVGSVRADTAEILRVVEEVRDHFRDLINANDVSWRNRGSTSH